MFLTRIQATNDSLLQSLNMQLSSGSTFQMGIYADNGGSPGSLLVDTGPLPAGAGLNTATLATPLVLIGGTYYWLAFHTDGSFYAQNSGLYPLWIATISTSFGPLPDPSGAYNQSAMVTYQAFGTTCP